MKNFSGSYLFLIISVVASLFLSYIDEGYYNFQWMKFWGNWIVLIIYAGIIFLVQQLFAFIFRKVFKVNNRNYLIAAIGVPVAIFVLVNIIFG